MRSFQPSGNEVQKGFTLMEVVIAVGIFSLVVVAAISIFIRLNAAQRKNQTKVDILNEMRFSVDLIGQEVLSGSAFPSGCDTGCTTTVNTPFVFATKIRPDVPLRRIEYYLDTVTGILMRGEQKTFGVCSTIPFLPSRPECYAPLTTSKASITQLTFYVINKVQDKQPIVTIVVNGSIQGEAFQLSSSFSPRFLQDPQALPPSDNVFPTIQITSPCDPISNNQCSPPYTTNAPSIVLGGIASDNVGVQSVTWTNQTNGTSGYAISSNGFATWTTDPSFPIILNPGEDNTIVVVATDGGGNASADTIVVTSTAPPLAPDIGAFEDCSGSGPGIYVFWNPIPSATEYHVYRCAGSCTPTAADEIGQTTNTFAGNYYWEDATDASYGAPQNTLSPGGSPGTTWSFNVRAHNHTTGVYSPFSNVATEDQPSFCAPPVTTSGNGVSGPSDSTSATGGGSGSVGVSASPNYLLVGVSGSPGTYRSSGASTITVTPVGGFSGSVSFSCSGIPSGSSCNFNPSSINAGGSASLTINVPNDTSIGNYGITVYASGDGASDSTGLTLSVFAAGGGQQ